MSLTKIALQAYKKCNYQEAQSIWKELADGGDDQAMTNLGIMYLKGEGVEKDLMKAKAYFESASLQENASALYNLGLMYYSTIGVKEDIEKGIEYLHRATLKGHGGANFRLALNYLQDRNSKDGLKKAFEYMINASKHGHAMASLQLFGTTSTTLSDDTPKNRTFRDKSKEQQEELIEDALNRYIRPMLIKDGGNIIFIEHLNENDDLEIRMCYMGSCAGCSLASTSTFSMIQNTLFQVIDEHIKVYIL